MWLCVLNMTNFAAAYVFEIGSAAAISLFQYQYSVHTTIFIWHLVQVAIKCNMISIASESSEIETNNGTSIQNSMPACRDFIHIMHCTQMWSLLKKMSWIDWRQISMNWFPPRKASLSYSSQTSYYKIMAYSSSIKKSTCLFVWRQLPRDRIYFNSSVVFRLILETCTPCQTSVLATWVERSGICVCRRQTR